MYANLKVSIGRRPVQHDRNGYGEYDEEVDACSVDVADGKATITLDDPDDESSYAAPIGKRVVDLTTHDISIAADF